MMIYLAFFYLGHIESPTFLEVYSKGGGRAMSMYRILSVIAVLVLVLVLVDFVTGYVKVYLKGELNSTIGLDRLIRKAMI